MSRRKQSRPQPFKQFLEERRSTKSDDSIEMPPTKSVKDEELSSSEEEVVDHHGNMADYKLPVEFEVGANGLVAASDLPASKVFGPYLGSVVKADPECRDNDVGKEKATTFRQVSDSEGTLYDITMDVEEVDCYQQWLTQLHYVTSVKEEFEKETANIAVQSQDGKLYLRTLKDIPQGCLLKAIFVKEDIRKGVKRPRSNGIYTDQEELLATNKKISTNSPCSQKTPDADATLNSMTSSDSMVTSSPSSIHANEATSSATETIDEKECIVKSAASAGSVAEEEDQEIVSQETTESMEKRPPYNCQHCCIEFRNPDNLDAHRTYYCPTTATQPLPASMRRVPPGANTVIKRRNRTPKQFKTVPCQVRSGTPPVANSLAVGALQEHPTGTYLCQLCQSSFTNHNNCESHMILLHCDETVNLCKFCNFIASTLSQLKVHVFTHVKYFVSTGSGSPEVYGSRSQGSPCASFQIGPSTSTGVLKVEEGSKPDKLTKYQEGEHEIDRNDSSCEIEGSSKQNKIQKFVDKERRSPSPESKQLCDNMPHIKRIESKHESETDTDKSSEHQLACEQCPFETTDNNLFQAHTNTHRLPVLKIPSTNHSSNDVAKSRKVVSPQSEQGEQVNRCLECNISFMSRQNFMAHKQFYCAGRHQISPEMPSRNICKTSPPLSRVPEEHIRHRVSQAPSSPTSSRSSASCHSNLASEKGGYQVNLPPNFSSSSSSNLSTPSPLPTMVQLTGPAPRPMSSGSSSPAVTSPPPMQAHPYIIPTGSVLSGMTPQGAPVLLVAVPFPGPGMRSEDQSVHTGIPSLPGTSRYGIPSSALMEEEKPLDLSVKASRSSPDVASSPTKTGAASPPRKLQQAPDQSNQPQSAVIDLSHITQSNLRPHPQLEQVNECKKCDIVFNKYESLLAHKQYYCASRHLRGRQIEMSYRQAVSPGRQSRSPNAPSDQGNRTESIMTQSYLNKSCSPTDLNHRDKADLTDTKSSIKISDSVERQRNTSVIIKQEIGEGIRDSNTCPKLAANNEQKLCNGTGDKTTEDFDRQEKHAEPEEHESSKTGRQGSEITETVEMCKASTSDRSTPSKEPRESESKDHTHITTSVSTVRAVKDTAGGGHPAMPDFSKQVQRPFSCQACTVSFMKLESLDVHQKFYCAARNVDIQHPSIHTDVAHNSNTDGKHVGEQGTKNTGVKTVEQVIQRDSLFCKGCGQYFATSKQVRCHSCKNGNQSGLVKHSVPSLKRSGQEESHVDQTNIADDTGPPLKRCKSDSVIKGANEENKEQTNVVIIKQEFVETSESGSFISDGQTGEVDKNTKDKKIMTQPSRNETCSKYDLKCEPKQDLCIASLYQNGNSPSLKEQSVKPQFGRTVNEPRQDAVSPTSMPTSCVIVKVEQEESNCSSGIDNQLLNSHPSNLPSDIPEGTTQNNSSVPSDTSKAKIGHHRVNSGVSLSGRSRVIQQPPAKHCNTCNIDFNSLSNFIAHKKYYCSARQQAKT